MDIENKSRAISLSDFHDFEDGAHENGNRYWHAHDFMKQLGYETYHAFSKVINKAVSACAQLDIQISEAFTPEIFIEDGKEVHSYKLTRFACFLVVMHADDKKPEVARAKIYFAAVASTLIEGAIAETDLSRIELREEVKVGEKILNSAAKSAGIQPQGYAFFKDAGIRGMYNLSLRDLMRRKGVDQKAVLYDFMGTTELAGNYFRVTQTAEKIRNSGISGQAALQQTANRIGRMVRATMIENSGNAPENLPISEDLNVVKRRLKGANRGMKKLDKVPARTADAVITKTLIAK